MLTNETLPDAVGAQVERGVRRLCAVPNVLASLAYPQGSLYLSLAKQGDCSKGVVMMLTEAQILDMKEAAIPLMVWLATNCHPHVQAMVDSEQVMIVEGVATASRVERQDLAENPTFTS